MFIEGDNLDVLPTLPARLGRAVDLIYIDPPYNTGNDFAYRDDFREDGSRRSRHQAWVAMMRPRLVAARDVLADTGAIFVSIDDNEVAHLRLLMDEVYGEDNLLAQVVVNLNPKGRQLGSGFATNHEYVLVYARDARRTVLDASSPDAVDERDFNLCHARRSALPAAAAAQHEQEVQPGHRADPALPGVGRPGERAGQHDAVRRGDRDRPGLRGRATCRLAVESSAHRRAPRRRRVPGGQGPGRRPGRRLPARLAAPRHPRWTTQEAAHHLAGRGGRLDRHRGRRAQGAGRPRLRVAQADRA